VGDDDLDLLHTGHCRGMTTDAAMGLSRATARADRVPPPGGLNPPCPSQAAITGADMQRVVNAAPTDGEGHDRRYIARTAMPG
jgi:hypothetical protein